MRGLNIIIQLLVREQYLLRLRSGVTRVYGGDFVISCR